MKEQYIPLSNPSIKGNELNYVQEALETEWVSSAGPFVGKFEQHISEYVVSLGAVACQSGTAGLHLALQACGVKAGDEVLVPTLTFIAAVNPVRYLDAYPVFMDCDDSLCVDPVKVEKFCDEKCRLINGELINENSGRRIRAIVIVHVFGNMADMTRLIELAKKYNLKIVEDATEALGTYQSSDQGERKYAGTLGDIGVFSFNGNKIVTTGGGGMIVSNDAEMLTRVKHLSTQAKSDELYYSHDEIGYNYRMGNVQAGIGLGQLEQLESFINTKETNYKIYKESIDKIEGLELLGFREGTRPNYWFYSLVIDKAFPLNRKQLIEVFETHKIQTRPVWGLIHKQLPYIDCEIYDIKVAEEYYQKILNLPCGSGLKENDVCRVIDVIKHVKKI